HHGRADWQPRPAQWRGPAAVDPRSARGDRRYLRHRDPRSGRRGRRRPHPHHRRRCTGWDGGGMKMGLHLTYATRSLGRGGQRAVLAILCVAIGVLALVALESAGGMVNTSLTGNIRALNGGDVAFSDARLSADQLATFDQLQASGAITTYTAVAVTQGSAE